MDALMLGHLNIEAEIACILARNPLGEGARPRTKTT